MQRGKQSSWNETNSKTRQYKWRYGFVDFNIDEIEI